MGDNDARVERLDPYETYGLQCIPKSRTESLEALQAELHREIARRAGAYGSRLAELFEALEGARQAFDAGLGELVDSALRRLGPQAARWSWGELIAGIEALPPKRGATLAKGARAVERSAELYVGLRAQAEGVRHHLIIHREAMGFRRHHLVDEKFPLPAALPQVEAAWRQARAGLKESRPNPSI
ncbi:MAG: hypothetical protein O6916_06540 [bacterium]|nr:hypothetical protein [bacterium]